MGRFRAFQAEDARLTLPQVNVAIQSRFPGWKLIKGNGYFYFDGPGAEKMYSTSVFVHNLNQLSVEKWLAEAAQIVDKAKRSDYGR